MKKERTNQKTKSKGNGEGTIYYSETLGKWVAQYIEPSTNKRKTLTQKKSEGIQEFKKRFSTIMNSINNGEYIGTSNETVISIIERHIKHKYEDGITSPRSYTRDLETLNQIKRCCSNFVTKPIQKVKQADIIASKKEIKKYSKSVINKIWGLLFKAFRIASSPSNLFIPYNIMDDEELKKPISDNQTKRIETLTIKEEEYLNDILDTYEKKHKYRNVVKLQLLTGMRIGEVLARSFNDIDENKTNLHIHNTLTQNINYEVILGMHTKTYNKNTKIDTGARYFPIFKEMKEILDEQLSNKITNMYSLLFWDYKKNKFITPAEIDSWLKRINKKYSITDNLSSHRLRHTKATRLKEAGVDMKVIQYLLGHVEGSSITDEVYISITQDFINEEIKKSI